MFDRRPILKEILVDAGSAAASSFSNPIGHGDDVRRAIRIALRDRDRWDCAHHLFVAKCLGPWAMKPDGLELVRTVLELTCCAKDVAAIAERRIKCASTHRHPSDSFYFEAHRNIDDHWMVGAATCEVPYDPRDDLYEAMEWLDEMPKTVQLQLPPSLTREDGLNAALDIMHHDKGPLARIFAKNAALGFLGFETEYNKILYREVVRLTRTCIEPALRKAPTTDQLHFEFLECLNPSKLVPDLRGEISGELIDRLWRIAMQYRYSTTSLLFLQALNGLSLEDPLEILAFDSVKEAELEDHFSVHGPSIQRPHQLDLFRQSVAACNFAGAGAVGVALLRDISSLPMLESLKQSPQILHDPEEKMTLAACLSLLDRKYLPWLRQAAFQPTDELPESHQAQLDLHYVPRRRALTLRPILSEPFDYRRVTITSPMPWVSFFPFDSPSMNHAMQHLTRKELNETAADARYECRMEAAIELAHRLRGRALTAMAGAAMRGAEPHDAVRLLHTLMLRDSEAARSIGLSLFEHPNWQVRLAAAGAVLNAAN